MKTLPTLLQDKLNRRIQANALRQLGNTDGLVDFSSNDYLGFSASKAIFDAAHQYLTDNDITLNGSTGSRLISGNHKLYAAAEEIISKFHNAESALIFNSGYDANVGFFSSVPQKGDVVLYDEYIHASIRDGLRLSNTMAYKFPHNNMQALTTLIERYRDKATEVYVVTESVFSMDGDSPDIAVLESICEAYSCRLVVDEAHALGVFGNKGEGYVQSFGNSQKIFARLITFGKGLGCHGAAILGSSELRSYLVNFARSFIYSTALPPHSLATIITAYGYLETTPSELNRLKDIIRFFTSEVDRLGLQSFISSSSAIQCAVIPGNEKVKDISSVLQQQGFSVKAILSPTVPHGQERLRFCLHCYNTQEQVTQVLQHLEAMLAVK